MSIPTPQAEPDLSEVIAVMKYGMSVLDANGSLPNDFRYHVYEKVLATIYGEDVFKWTNEKLQGR